MTSLLESVGAQPKNPSRGKSIFPAPRFENGLFTNRNPLHDVASWLYSKYGGYPDTLIDGNNMEISNKLTLARRPGLSQWSNQVIPDQPNWFYDWRTLDCGVKVVVDTPTSTYIQSATTQNLIFTKSAGAGQGYYQGVADTLYYGDGIDLQQFIMGPSCSVSAGKTFNWGIQKPTQPLTLTVVPTASASQTWVASTVFSTMGLIVDSVGNIQQLISVNAQGGNATQFGLTGNGQPAWNQTPGGTTTDNGHNWTNWGPIVLWTPSTVYNNVAVGGTIANPCIIYDPNTKCCFYNAAPGSSQGTSGTSYPNFPSAFGANIHDPANQDSPPAVKWFNLGSLKTPPVWQPSHSYQNRPTSADFSLAGIAEPTGLINGLPTNQTIFWQVNNTGSAFTSGTGGTAPAWNPVLGAGTGTQTFDNQLIWLSLGSGTRVINHAYTAWTAMGTTFSVIVDSNNNYQVCTTSGVSSSTATGSITWSTGYNQTTVDGTVTWTCVGNKMTWAANTSWFLPTTGWFPPSGSIPYGGALIIDSNNNVQAVTESGLSGTPTHPAWVTTPVGGTTTDNTITWSLVGPFSAVGFSETKGASYGYSYESRTSDDPFNTTAPPDWPSPLGPPTGSETGHISTASPLTDIGITSNSVVNLTIPCSSDPQVDTIVIWRTLDGGSILFFLTEVPNIQPIGGVQQFQHVQDTSADSVINELISAPINDQNDPPPAGFLPMAFHFERIWGAVGNFVFVSGGPDVVTGNGNESFDPLDFFQFPSPVTRIVPTATGILVFLTNDVYAILGGPIFNTFFATPMVPGIGLLHYNALDVHGAVVFLYTADNQFISMDPSGGAQRMGGPIADKLQLFDARKVFVTVHEDGNNDNAIFVSDGSTGWYRLNPYQFPNNNSVWSTFATITGGAGAVLSIEVTTGVHKLLVGGVGPNTFIGQRDFTTFQDNGTPYTCFGTVGSLNLASPGQIAGVTFANVRATKVGTAPTVSFLLNEIFGTFTDFPDSQPYPWQIYGATTSPSSLFSNAYYFRAAGVPALCEHLQIKMSFPAENVASEILTFSLFAIVEQSPED